MAPTRVIRSLAIATLTLVLFSCLAFASDSVCFKKGKLLYDASMKNPASVKGWKMEGPGELEFKNGWMEISSPGEEMHHVFWCPKTFPDSFIAEWECQNLETDAGLCIVFFAAKGENGKGIFHPSLPKRNGDFQQYIRGEIVSYHISYYANAAHKPDRGHANLRKNNEFLLVQQGDEGVPTKSEKIHRIRLVKDGPHIVMFVDDRKIIDWTDPSDEFGPAHTDGKIGLRQMKWTHFRYRKFRVWSLKKDQ